MTQDLNLKVAGSAAVKNPSNTQTENSLPAKKSYLGRSLQIVASLEGSSLRKIGLVATIAIVSAVAVYTVLQASNGFCAGENVVDQFDNATNTTYTGCVVDGNKEGFGKLVLQDGICIGQFKNNTGSGEVKCTYEDGESYDGHWFQGLRHGKGAYAEASGDRCEGDWFQDLMHGNGVCTWAGGDRYEGGWFQDQKHGNGVFTWADGARYEGGWKYDYLTGNGTYTYADESRFEGGWKNGLMHGQGKWIATNGTVLQEGRWVNGRMTTVSVKTRLAPIQRKGDEPNE